MDQDTGPKRRGRCPYDLLCRSQSLESMSMKRPTQRPVGQRTVSAFARHLWLKEAFIREAKKPKPTPDQAAAHEFLSELRTRISTQLLPYQYGVETRALESLWEVFGHARAAMKNHPGCAKFAQRTTEMLNRDLR